MSRSTGPEPLEKLVSLPSSTTKQNIHKLPVARFEQVPAEVRNQALCDLHAVPEPLSENPAMILHKLEVLDFELQRAEIDKSAFEEAMQQAPHFVNSWKLRFLRAERFDGVRSAERMILHFTKKKAIFGQASLGRELTMDDLSPSELTVLQSGCLQFLPHRDRGDRSIFAVVGSLETPCPLETLVKLQFLMTSFSSEDAEIQKKGVVSIVYSVGRKTSYFARVAETIALWSALPIRLVALHCCYDVPGYHDAMKEAARTIDSRIMCRTRCHFGTQFECQSNLAMFGIPKHSIPLNHDGAIDCKHHHDWMLEHKKIQLHYYISTAGVFQAQSSEEVLGATQSDVVMGRGQRKHPGNLRLRRFLEKHLDLYDAETWLQKRSFCARLFGQLTKSGTRFVTLSQSGMWLRIDDEAAVDKIAHVFRDLRRDSRRASP